MYTQECEPQLSPVRRRVESIDGTEENLLWRVVRTWSVVTDQFQRTGSAPTPRDLVQEFIASVMGGETFVFDPYRLPGGGADVLLLSVTLVDGSVSFPPIDPSSTMCRGVSFTVREVAMVT
jgi:hypothetical protein